MEVSKAVCDAINPVQSVPVVRKALGRYEKKQATIGSYSASVKCVKLRLYRKQNKLKKNQNLSSTYYW